MKKYFFHHFTLLFIISLAALWGCASNAAPDANYNASAAPKITTRLSATDGKTMVLVPAGEFQMGTSDSQLAMLQKDWGLNPGVVANETPTFQLSLPDFYIDQTPVTNAEYKKFVDANPKQVVPFVDENVVAAFNWEKTTRSFPAARGNYPVVLVTWHDAVAYCQWAGKRLPTEAEWEKAARGTDARLWPWGNQWDTTKANSKEQQNADLAPVGQFTAGASPYGALDMVGNIWQWTSSLDKAYPYVATDGREDANAAGLRITRGGSWGFGASVDRTSLRNRFAPANVSASIGFRCAQ
jgi:formylglycine-generating enzyme required for sulfatase activity